MLDPQADLDDLSDASADEAPEETDIADAEVRHHPVSLTGLRFSPARQLGFL